MKKIEAVIQPEKFKPVCLSLEKLNYPGMMITKVSGHGRQKGVIKQWLGKQFRYNFLPKLKLELVVPDKALEATVQCILEAADTGHVGAGKIFITEVEDAIRISTRERKNKALL